MAEGNETIETQEGIHLSIEEQLDEHIAKSVSGDEYNTEGTIDEQLAQYACN